MNKFQMEESYWESEFDIYQEYNSNSGSNNFSESGNSKNQYPIQDNSFVREKPRVNTHNEGKSNNISEVIIGRDQHDDNQHIDQLFKRPSKTMKANRKSNTTSMNKKGVWNYKKQIESCFVHK